jgi:Antibiotic biosynthesis monooxygenase
MAEPFIFINTYTIKPGKEEAYKTAHQKVADLVEAKEPKMLYFALHTSEDGSEATTVQVHADAENFGYHMSLVEDHVRAAHEYLNDANMAIRIFGFPTAAILDQMRQLAGSGVSVTVSPPTLGFNRFGNS